MTKNDSWKINAQILNDGTRSWRSIAKELNVPSTTVRDFLKKCETQQTSPIRADYTEDFAVGTKQPDTLIKIKTDPTLQGPTIIYIPDSQVKPDTNTEYLRCISEYIAYKKPDVIVCAGDFADMPSLSSYDKGKKSAEGKRVSLDIQASIDGMNILLSRLEIAQMEDPQWKPRMVLTLGNHEERIIRHVEANPELEGFLSIDDLKYEAFGWEVVPYLVPIVIGGVTFIHYWPNPMSGKPLGGSAANLLKTVSGSVVTGHKQTLDVATRTLHTGVQQWSIIAGASYDFDEVYKGFTGNKHWRGIIYMQDVKDGGFSPMFIDIEYLKKRFKKEK